MANPRITLKCYPLYPTSLVLAAVQVVQVKRKLLNDGHYDTIEHALPGPTDPATISWLAGGTVSLGGPLANLIATTLGYDTAAMTAFLLACANIII